MAFSITDNAFSALNQIAKEPNIVLEIEGVSTIFGSITIRRYAIVGDDLTIGDPEVDPNAFYIGGLARLEGQTTAILLGDTSNSIRQMLNIDKGEAGTISNMSVGLMDVGDITEIITPGEIIPDILGAKCKVFLGFGNVAWPDDYITIFRGTVSEVTSDAGKVVLQLNSPDNKKAGNLYKKVSTSLPGSITSGATSILLSSAAGLLQKITGPGGGIDAGLETYVRIDNEVIKYTAISVNTLTGCVRGSLGTLAAAHSADATVDSIYVMSGNCVDISLKLLASGFNGPFRSGVDVTSFNLVEALPVVNAVYFASIDVAAKYNLQVGDFVTTTGATNGANNFTLREVTEIVETEDGSYIVVGGAALVAEASSPAVIAFRSKYDVWPDGVRLDNDEIDFEEHLRLQELFLSNFNYTFYLKETIEKASEFLEMEVYSPVAAYSLPRKSRASIGYHIGPIPGSDIQVLDETSIKSASKSKLIRTTNRNFYNEIVYKLDEDLLEERFVTGVITISATSKNQIKAANKSLTIASKGLRSADLGEAIAVSQSNRRLNRYQFAAESIKLSTTFDAGFTLEVGDIVVYDGSNLKLPDIKVAAKGMAPRLFEITNKDINLKTGDVGLELVDTNYNGAGRYCLMSPSSLIATGTSTTEFTIKESFSGKFGANEYRKWSNLVGASVIVRSADFTTIDDCVITAISFNAITVSPALSFTPSANMVLELTHYDDVDVTDTTKLIYGHMRNSAFADGGAQYLML